MRVIIAAPLFPPEIEDIANYAKDLAEHLKKENQVSVLAFSGQTEAMPGIDIFAVNKRAPLFLRIFAYFIKLNKLARQADIIYVQNAVAAGLPAVLVKMFTGKPVVINFAEDEAWKRARFLHLSEKSWQQFLAEPEGNNKINLIRKLQTWVLRRATRVVVSSESLAQAVIKSYHLSPDKVAVNYPVADEPLQLPFDQTVNKNQILIFGQDFDLVSDKWGKAWKIIFANKRSISRAELMYLTNTSALVVYNIKSENFDNFLLDCVALGKNILACDTSYTREIFGQSGTRVDFSDKSVVLEKATQLLDDQTANKNTQSRFDWSSHLAKLQEIFQASIKK